MRLKERLLLVLSLTLALPATLALITVGYVWRQTRFIAWSKPAVCIFS